MKLFILVGGGRGLLGFAVKEEADDKTVDAGNHQFGDVAEKVSGQKEISTHQNHTQDAEKHGQTFAGEKAFHRGN